MEGGATGLGGGVATGLRGAALLDLLEASRAKRPEGSCLKGVQVPWSEGGAGSLAQGREDLSECVA